MANRKTEYTEEELIRAIIDMRLNKSMSHKSVLDFLQKELGYSVSHSHVLIKKAKVEISNAYKEMNISAVEESVYQIEEVMEWARAQKNFKLWMELRKELNKIKGVYAAEKIDIKGDLNHTISVIKLNGPGHIQIEKKDDEDKDDINKTKGMV
jgi:hypothetical protein